MHQSWTGTVAVYLPRLPRIALYVTPASAAAPTADTSAAAVANPPHQTTTLSGAGTAASGPSPATGPAHGATGLGGVMGGGGGGSAAARPGAGGHTLASAPGRGAVKGTWVVSSGRASLTGSLSDSAFELKVTLDGRVLWHQDLFSCSYGPRGSGGAAGAAGAAGSASGAEPGSAEQQLQDGGGGPPAGGGVVRLIHPAVGPLATTGAPGAAAGAGTGSSDPWMLLLQPAHAGGSTADGRLGAAAAAAGVEVGGGGAGGGAQGMFPSLSTVCFRFNSAEEGRACLSLLEAAQQAAGRLVQRAEDWERRQAERRARREQREVRRKRRRQEQEARVMERGRATTCGVALRGAVGEVGGGCGVDGADVAAAAAAVGNWLGPGAAAGTATGRHLTTADIRVAIERYLLEPDFQDLVARVESVWEQMEQQAEQQLAGQEQLQQQ